MLYEVLEYNAQLRDNNDDYGSGCVSFGYGSGLKYNDGGGYINDIRNESGERWTTKTVVIDAVFYFVRILIFFATRERYLEFLQAANRLVKIFRFRQRCFYLDERLTLRCQGRPPLGKINLAQTVCSLTLI